MSDDCPYLLRAAAIAAQEATFSHPWNAKSELTGTQLGRLAGLKRTGVSIARIPPGHLTNPFDEDLVYLMGGESLEHEIADFPALDRRMIRLGDRIDIHRLSDAAPFPGR